MAAPSVRPRLNQLTEIGADCAGYWRLRDYLDHTVSFSDGMAWRHYHQRVYWQLLIRRRSDLVRHQVNDNTLILLLGIGMVISAQWELVLGNTYAYTVLSAFGFFYGGFGAIVTPLFGVTSSYGANTVEYNNALGFFVLSKYF